MSAKTNYLENALVNHVLRNTSFTSPGSVYIALFTSDPGEAGGGTEVSGGSYVRLPVTFDAPADGVTQNSADLTWPVATANWGTITHFGLMDALSSGDMLYYGALSNAKEILTDDIFEIVAGNLVVQEL